MTRTKLILACVLVVMFSMLSTALVTARESTTLQINRVTMFKDGVATTNINSGDEVTVQLDIVPDSEWVYGQISTIIAGRNSERILYSVANLDFAPGVTSLTTQPFVIKNGNGFTVDTLVATISSWTPYNGAEFDFCILHPDGVVEDSDCYCEFPFMDRYRFDEVHIPITVSGYEAFPPFIHMPHVLWIYTGAIFVNEPLSLHFEASGTGELSWKLESGNLPNGLQLSEDGYLSGTPTEHGVFVFTLSVSSDYGRDEQTFTLMILEEQRDYPGHGDIGDIEIGNIEVTVYKDGVETTEVKNGDTVTVGVNITPVERDVLAITPIERDMFVQIFVRGHSAFGHITEELVGTIRGNNEPLLFVTEPFTIKDDWIHMDICMVIRRGQISSVDYIVPVTIHREGPSLIAPVIITPPNFWLDYLMPYEYYMQASGANVTWSLVGGALPPNVTLSPCGLISGTPTLSGVFTFTIKASNEHGSYAKEFYMLVMEDNWIMDEARLSVSTATANAGEEVTVHIDITDNPGFATMPLKINFPENLTLVRYSVDASLREGFTGPARTNPGQTIAAGLSSPVYMNWARTSDYVNDGTLLTLTFKVAENTAPGKYPINVDFMDIYGYDTPRDRNDTHLNIYIVNGFVEIQRFVLGDVNGNGRLDLFDATLITRYLAGHTNLDKLPGVVNFNIEAGIVTSESVAYGRVRLMDAVTIARHLAGHPGVVLVSDPMLQM